MFVDPLRLTLSSRYQGGGDVGFTPAWARGTAARGTRTRERYRPHYSSTSARALLGTLRTLVVFSLEDIISQSLQMVSGVSP